MAKNTLIVAEICLLLVGCGSGSTCGEHGDESRDGIEVEWPGKGEWSVQPKPLARIPGGTRFDRRPPQGWSNIVLFVEGRLGSGDVSAASARCHYYASKFNLVWLANVRRGETGRYYLDKLATGFSTKINGENTIVTAATQEKLGANLGVIGAAVLSGNEVELKGEQVARCRTSMLVDSPTIVLYQGDHREMLFRYLIWVSPSNGRIGTTVWLLDRVGPNRDHHVVEDTFQYLPANLVENRIMNVKGDRFTFGIPSKDAFAVVRIPQGTPFRFTPELRKYAGRARFTKDTCHGLLAAMSRALNAQSDPRQS